MILTLLTKYLSEHRRASLADVAMSVQSAPAAVEAMLLKLERKGLVRRLPLGASCGHGCTHCDPTALQLYEWLGHERAR